MEKTFVIFGRIPQLSFAELYHYTNGGQFDAVGQNGAILESAVLGVDAPAVLGGAVKAGTVVDSFSAIKPEQLAGILIPELAEGEKFHFGLSAYSYGGKAPSSYDIKKLGLSVKKILKATGASVRLVESRNNTLSSVDVVKNKLLERGVELCLLYAGTVVYVGRTRSVQPFEAYSERDYDRPGRDAKRGMLPPKLARTMLHLARAQEGETVLDPFCGVGTVLQEGVLLGCKMIGTDIDDRAILNSKKNLEWLLKETGMGADYHVEPYDVRQLDKKLTPESVDAIASELDLGPPLFGTEPIDFIQEVERGLSELYTEALAMMHTLLKPGARAVIAWPYFIEHGVWVSAYNRIEYQGWNIIAPYAENYQAILPLSKRKTLLYGRDGQHVYREIVILEKPQTN